ncbi:MAG: NosD domain-containing protein [Candidatus Lokiarchaeia archaeon]
MFVLLTLGIIFTLSAISFCNLNFIAGTSEKVSEYSDVITLDNENLKLSKVSGKIHIDNNWSATKTALICTGSGSYSDPYVIEDLIINASGSGSGIWIQDSTVFFKIENCTVYNSGNNWDDAGIKLGANVDNGQLIDNIIHHNFVGIFLESSDNNTITGNIITNNIDAGMRVFYSYNNTFSGNIANDNEMGMDFGESGDNTISGNIANGNTNSGIHIKNSSKHIIFGNNLSRNDQIGIYIDNSANSTISENYVIDSGWENAFDDTSDNY